MRRCPECVREAMLLADLMGSSYEYTWRTYYDPKKAVTSAAQDRHDARHPKQEARPVSADR